MSATRPRRERPDSLHVTSHASSVTPRGLALDPVTLREALGADADDPHAVACLRFDVLAAVRRLEEEVATGKITSGVRRVHGRPLADWLDLADVARRLRASSFFPNARAPQGPVPQPPCPSRWRPVAGEPSGLTMTGGRSALEGLVVEAVTVSESWDGYLSLAALSAYSSLSERRLRGFLIRWQ